MASITSEFVRRASGSKSRKRPEWVTGWKKTPVTAGCSTPKRTIAPSSSSLMPRSTAAASDTPTPAFGAPVERAQLLLVEQPAADGELRRVLEAVELQVDVNADLGQGRREARIAREPGPVGVEHDELDAARPWPRRASRGSAGEWWARRPRAGSPQVRPPPDEGVE